MRRFPCPYLQREVELTDEREQHITENHPDLLPDHLNLLASTIATPDQVRRSSRFSSARLFTRWYNDLQGGKYVVVVVVTDETSEVRHWIITAYMARKLAEAEIEWRRS